MGQQDEIRARVRHVADRVAASEGLELVDVELHGRGPGTVVRIFLDKPGGVTHGDCQTVSHQVGTILDVENLIDSRYTLEVSSPGLDRRLVKPTDYQRFAGQSIKLMLNSADGRRQCQGRLAGLDDGKVRVETEAGTVQIDLGEIERANLVPEFPKVGSQQRPGGGSKRSPRRK